jgi:GNAT superfamily N-acetyltransferase
VARRGGHFVESARGEIEQLYVRPEARRSGAGRALAQAALAWLAERGAPRVEVAVSERNAAGRAFWAALGFAPTSVTLERRV